MDGLDFGTQQPISFTSSAVPLPLAQDVYNGGLTIDGTSVLGDSTYNTGYNTGGTSGGGGTTSYTQGVNDPTTLAAYTQAINNTQSAIDRLPSQYNSGAGAIDASYTNALNQLLLGKNQANATYDTNKTQTGQDYVAGKNTVGANAGSSLNSLLRLLGSRGAGGGSPVFGARGAVAREASLQRSDLGRTFGQNNQALDTNWNNYLTGYNNQVAGAGSQRDQSKQTLQSQIDTNKASLLQTLAQLNAQKTGGTTAAQPYLDQANALLDKTANYSTAPINYQTQAYTAPDLSKYTTSPNPTPTYQGTPAGNDFYSPYLSALLGKKQTAGAV